MKNKILFWSITVALAGFLFGFDTVVISGADKKLQALWDSSNMFHGTVVMAMALWGTVIGAIFGGIPTNKIGRKNTLIWIGVLYTISAIGSASANDPFTFAFFRFIGGLGVGASTIAAPAYVSEIAPAKDRGKLVALYQFNIVLGILIAFLSNYLLRNIGENAWRWMIGVEAIPAIIYTLMVITVPKSPRWLLLKGRDIEAKKILQITNPDASIDSIMEEIQEHQNNIKVKGKETIFMKKYHFPLMLAFLIAFFNQFSGINAFLYYAPRIFEEAGLGESTALLSYIFSLSLVAIAFFLGWKGMFIPVFLFIFIAAHAIGQGAVIWVFISEIFPNNLRASGQSFGSSTHWILAAIIPSLVPFLFEKVGAGVVFAVFAFMMVLQLLFVIFLMPETKGITLEDLEKKLIK